MFSLSVTSKGQFTLRVQCSARLSRGRLSAWLGVCLPQGVSARPGDVCLARGVFAWPRGFLPGQGLSAWPGGWTDRHLWKHNLSATTVADGKNTKQSFLIRAVLYLGVPQIAQSLTVWRDLYYWPEWRQWGRWGARWKPSIPSRTCQPTDQSRIISPAAHSACTPENYKKKYHGLWVH